MMLPLGLSVGTGKLAFCHWTDDGVTVGLHTVEGDIVFSVYPEGKAMKVTVPDSVRGGPMGIGKVADLAGGYNRQ